MKLHGYWRSSASYRVRIALALKVLEVEHVAVHLVKDGGRQLTPEFRTLNPMAQVPVLEIEDEGQTLLLTQSVAILEYLEERFPEPALLPRGRIARAEVRRCVEICNAGIQPLQNLSLMRAIKKLGGDDQAFAREANEKGLGSLEAVAKRTAGRFLVGDTPTFADVCLVPQIFSARRFGLDVARFPLLSAIDARCAELAAFVAAHPDRQPDADPPQPA